jgi:Predicted membrane protein
MDKGTDELPAAASLDAAPDPLRFLLPHSHLAHVFGNDWFALKAEAFARFFGTPMFLVGQTVLVAVWIGLNVAGPFHFDVYPFILLNLAFSLQAAYAAPLILLAQTRQAQRDKAHTEADAQHREDIARAAEERELLAARQAEQLQFLMTQNTQLTELVRDLTLNIQALTLDVHTKVVKPN